MSSFNIFLVVSLLSCLRGFHACNYTCPDRPVFTPSSEVVKYGDPFSMTCQACKSDCNHDSALDVEAPIGVTERNGTNILWRVANTTEWNMKSKCFYERDDGVQCCTEALVIVYQLPVNISVSFVNHNGPMLAGRQYTLQCTVQDVAPVGNLTVTLYRGQTALEQQQYDDEEKKPVTKVLTWTFNVTEEDGEAGYRCEATLALGSKEPSMASENLITTVHYAPKVPTKTSVITITEGSRLYLNCSAKGNPSPSYTWTFPPKSGAASSYDSADFTVQSVTLDHAGNYTCNARNIVGNVTVTFRVEVHVNLIPYIIAGAIVLAVLLLCCLVIQLVICYRRYKMGQYNLKDVFHLQTWHVAVPTDG